MNGEAAQDAAPEAPPWQRAYAALSDATLGDNAVDPAEDSWGSGCCICALITNRARECGLAAFNPSTFKLSLCQYVESSKSHPSITHLLLQAYECVSAVVLGNGAPATRDDMPETSGDAGELMAQILPFLPEDVHTMPRSAFNDTKAIALLPELCTPESWSKVSRACSNSSGLYLALAATAALLQLLQTAENLVLTGTLDIEIVGTSAHLRLDAGSLTCLEVLPRPSVSLGLPVVRSGPAARTGAAGAGAKGHALTGALPPAPHYKPQLAHRSLFDLMNHTRTSVGARLLRASLLQPLTDITAINFRYDAVDELISTPALALDVAKVLTALPRKLERLCNSLATSRGRRGAAGGKADPGRRIRASITAVLQLRSVLQLVPRLSQALSGADSELLRAVRTTCGDACFVDMGDRINQVMDEEASTGGFTLVNRIQQCFAVKTGAHDMLDVARTSFCRLTDQVHQLTDQYRQSVTRVTQHDPTDTGTHTGAHQHRGGNRDHPPLQVKVQYNDRTGFYLSLSLAEGAGTGLTLDDVVMPRGFVPLGKRTRQAVLATTPELSALNARLRDMAHDCLVLTEQVMDGLLEHLVANMTLLLRLVDNLALTDMLLAFAQLAQSQPSKGGYCRPQLVDAPGAVLAIAQGRHPLLECVPGCTVRSNDTSLDGDCSALHVITGPNMAGKSTYLKQVGLLVIMAQAGSFVPADSMVLTPRRQLFTRMGHGDNIETNSSSFMVEMQEMGLILDYADPHSLVLVDELGRGTSTLDGVALCWAAAEALVAARALTLLATHFPQLTDLPQVYPQARVYTLQVDVEGSALSYTWQLTAPSHTADTWSYGLALAETLGFPASLLSDARRISAAQLAAQAAARQERADPAAQRDMETLRRVMLLAHTAAQWERDQRPATDPEEFGEAEGDVSRDEGAEAEAAQGKGALSAEQAQWLYDELVKLGSLNLGLGTTM